MRTYAVVIVLLMLLLGTGAAYADGCYFMRETDWRKLREKAFITEPEQKALILFNNGQEDLIISPSYQGAAADFAWVIPVPARPKVATLEGALFHEMAALQPLGRYKKAAAPASKSVGKSDDVKVIERKTVGDYDVSVLEANNGHALLEWLTLHQYHLHAAAEKPLSTYVHEKWTFVACRIKAPATAAAGLQQGILAPLRLTFRTRKPVYPMRLSAANHDPFIVQLYLVLPTRLGASFDVVYAPAQPRRWNIGARAIADLATPREHCPTLAKLYAGAVRVYSQSMRIAPNECTADYVWQLDKQQVGALSGRSTIMGTGK